jgi:hypothetical protein
MSLGSVCVDGFIINAEDEGKSTGFGYYYQVFRLPFLGHSVRVPEYSSYRFFQILTAAALIAAMLWLGWFGLKFRATRKLKL